jgi:hypothetical protein
MKNINKNLKFRLFGAAVAAAALITPSLASAQELPAYADAGGDQQIQGTVAGINGTWNISVADANGYNDSVELHQGTIINPTGLTLEPGMSVTIDGYADGSNFDATEIDTPYQYQGPAPVAVYYGPGSWYPGYAYGWGPSFSLAVNLGNGRFEQRSFAFGGQARHPIAPPSGWQNAPHGFVGNRANARPVSYAAPQQERSFAAPQQQARSFARAPQQQERSFAAPQQQERSFAAQQQQVRSFAAPQQQERSFAAPQQQERSFSRAPQQERSFAAPQQQARSFAASQQRYSAPAARVSNSAPRGGGDRGDHGRG